MRHALAFGVACCCALRGGAGQAFDPYSVDPPAVGLGARKVPKDPAAAQLLQQLQDAADAGNPSFTIAAGDYNFSDAPLTLRNANGLAVSAAGATLWFSVGGGVQLTNCVGVAFDGLTVDYDPPPYAQGTLVSLSGDGKELVADFDPTFTLPDPSRERFFQLPYNGSVKVAFWDPQTRTMLRDAAQPAAINVYAAGFAAAAPPEGRYRIALRIDAAARVSVPIPAGAGVTVFPRGASHTVVMQGCANVTLTDVSLYGGSSMGIVEAKGGGGNRYERLRMTRRPNRAGVDRLLAVNADGFHSTSNRVGPTIVDSEIAFVGDDLGNVCCFMVVAIEVNATAGRVAVVDGHGGTSPLELARAGDVVTFSRLNTFAAQGAATLRSVALSSDPRLAALAAGARAKLAAAPYNANFQDAAMGHPKVYVLEATGPLPSGVAAYWSLGVLDSLVNAGVRVERSSFHDGYARVWMVKAQGAQVLANDFARSGGVHVGAEQNWLEGDPSMSGVLIADNTGVAIGDPPIEVGESIAAGVTLRNNSFAAAPPPPPPPPPGVTTAWRCVQADASCQSHWLPMRCWQGAAECLSADHKGCAWRSSEADCEAVLADPPVVTEPTGVDPKNCVAFSCAAH